MDDLDPIAQLNNLFVDNIGQDWEILDSPEEDILGVPKGTVERLLRQIQEKNLWSSLYKVAQQHSEQWMLDLSSFFPREEKFIEPFLSFFLLSDTVHAKVSLAQEADEWPWGSNTKHLLPIAIQRITQLREEIKGGNFDPVVPTLDRAIKSLSELTLQLK